MMLRLAEVDQERLAELVIDAWPMRAPRAIASELAENPGAADPPNLATRPGQPSVIGRPWPGPLGGIVADSDWW
ncbi:MAG TPA: hypothetical protein VKD66_04405 [Streptosporangiaceae bacterium]|nr:hypothetical protein [Streptosporangiaceae bacterium]